MRSCFRITLVVLTSGWLSLSALAADLPELNIDLRQTTVSGISSGAFMAVQLGVAKSSYVRGVAATAGGPYLCALDSAYSPAGATASIARCMQGDPTLKPAPTALGQADMANMVRRTHTAAKWQKIDPVENLNRQAVWVFHGYNDGIVKLPVSQALTSWYQQFTPASQVFHKDNLNAAHAQISAACSASDSQCNLCSSTGGSFINSCQNQPSAPDQVPYDAAGSALQMFYGPLTRTTTEQLGARPQTFSQLPFLKLHDGSHPGDSGEIAMADTGYFYAPRSCAEGQVCRLHIAFHGCMQSATTLGTTFVERAGVNEWADANNIVVLYPQAMPTNADIDFQNPVKLAAYKANQPFNPMGCWDWWGYNDNVLRRPGAATPGGAYATSEGLQMAAVWRMAEKLAAKGRPDSLIPTATSQTVAPQLTALDQTATQALLRWQPVRGASAYQVYRREGSQAARPVGKATPRLFWADSGLLPKSRYRYTVRAVMNGKEGPDSNAVSVVTAPATPGCDPYFSLQQNTPVDRHNVRTDAVCR